MGQRSPYIGESEIRFYPDYMSDTVVVDFGCGNNKLQQANIGIDIRPETDADIVVDAISTGLPFNDNSIDCIYCYDVLEHIGEGIVDLIEDFHRVLKLEGQIIAKIPMMDPPSQNPLHRRTFDPEWFYSWDPSRTEHNKWDNFQCVPFNVTQSDHKRWWRRPWRIVWREFTMEKINSCPDHL